MIALSFLEHDHNIHKQQASWPARSSAAGTNGCHGHSTSDNVRVVIAYTPSVHDFGEIVTCLPGYALTQAGEDYVSRTFCTAERDSSEDTGLHHGRLLQIDQPRFSEGVVIVRLILSAHMYGSNSNS